MSTIFRSCQTKQSATQLAGVATLDKRGSRPAEPRSVMLINCSRRREQERQMRNILFETRNDVRKWRAYGRSRCMGTQSVFDSARRLACFTGRGEVSMSTLVKAALRPWRPARTPRRSPGSKVFRHRRDETARVHHDEFQSESSAGGNAEISPRLL